LNDRFTQNNVCIYEVNVLAAHKTIGIKKPRFIFEKVVSKSYITIKGEWTFDFQNEEKVRKINKSSPLARASRVHVLYPQNAVNRQDN
jgi:hypothetical protein